MRAPKSDTATIEARRHRLLELLAEGNTQAQAADILRSEGFPASTRTIRRDVMSFAEQFKELNRKMYQQWKNQEATVCQHT